MKIILMGLLLAASGLSATAQILNLSTDSSSIGHGFYPEARSTVDWIYGSFWGSTPASPFSANLSAYESLRLTVSAPAGQEFLVQSHPGSIGGVFSVGSPLSIWHAPGWDSGLRYSLPVTITFADYTGPAWYNNTVESSVDTDGLAFFLQGGLWWSGAPEIRFSSVTVEVDLTSLAPLLFPSATYTPDLAVGFRFQDVLAAAPDIDPGPAVSLVGSTAVPEPAAYGAISGLLLVFGAAYSRRKRIKSSH
jgi:hypothetical protein